MHNARLISATLVVAVLSLACGGDTGDSSAPAAVSELFASGTTLPAADTAPSSDTADTAPTFVGGAQELIVFDPPRLGSRFEWCGELQAVWDANVAADLGVSEAFDAAEAAGAALRAATDDLDKAEASAVLADALHAADVARSRLRPAVEQSFILMRDAERLHAERDRSPRGIAYTRAWQAFVDAGYDAYWDALEGLEAAEAAFRDAVDAAERAERDTRERRPSQYGESFLAGEAADAESAAYQLARTTADINFFNGTRSLHAVYESAIDALYDYRDDRRDGVLRERVEDLDAETAEILAVVDAAAAAHPDVRSLVADDRLADYDALVADFEEQAVVLREAVEAYTDASWERIAGVAALYAERDLAQEASAAALEARNAAAGRFAVAEHDSVYTPAYAAFMASLAGSCA